MKNVYFKPILELDYYFFQTNLKHKIQVKKMKKQLALFLCFFGFLIGKNEFGIKISFYSFPYLFFP